MCRPAVLYGLFLAVPYIYVPPSSVVWPIPKGAVHICAAQAVLYGLFLAVPYI